jgi:hypothetical protein
MILIGKVPRDDAFISSYYHFKFWSTNHPSLELRQQVEVTRSISFPLPPVCKPDRNATGSSPGQLIARHLGHEAIANRLGVTQGRCATCSYGPTRS